MSMLEKLGRRLLPLFHPTRAEDRRVLRELAATIDVQRALQDRLGADLRDARSELHALRAQTTALRDAVSAGLAGQRQHIDASAHHVEIVNRDNLRRLQETVSRNSGFLKEILGNGSIGLRHAIAEEQVMMRLGRIAASGRPIVVGPWAGEVGFELLYWVPFVRWFVEEFSVDPARLIVVSRGGPVSWYGGLGGHYVDSFDFVEPGAFAMQAGSRKQNSVGPRDRAIIDGVRAGASGRVSILHPKYLYQLCQRYFYGFSGTRSVLERLRPRRIDAPLRTLLPGLPGEYVAAKFYFSAAFPDTPENRAFVDASLARVRSRLPVVLLQHGIAVDDHHTYASASDLNLDGLGVEVTPANNLEIQTIVVANARAFVGTYGGFAYLAPLCGVRATAFHSSDEFYEHHRQLADVTFSRLHLPPLTVLPTSATALVGDAEPLVP